MSSRLLNTGIQISLKISEKTFLKHYLTAKSQIASKKKKKKTPKKKKPQNQNKQTNRKIDYYLVLTTIHIFKCLHLETKYTYMLSLDMASQSYLNSLPHFSKQQLCLSIFLLVCQARKLTDFLDVSFFVICYAKSLQSCPTLCDPIDGSPQGSPIPGILQARTLEWVAISFFNA